MTPDDQKKRTRPSGETGRRAPSVRELAAAVAELRGRVEALEQTSRRAATPAFGETDLIRQLREHLATAEGTDAAAGAVIYAGYGPRGPGEVAWQVARLWPDVLATDRTRTGRPLAALASPARLEIIGELVAGPLSRQELKEKLDQSSAGQLNHHLRELLAAGLVEQPRRGVYAVPARHVVPLLTLLACAADLTSGSGEPEPSAEQPIS